VRVPGYQRWASLRKSPFSRPLHCRSRERIGIAGRGIVSRVRFLFTFAGGRGHLEPLVPLAQAAVAAGHEVAFAGRPWMIPKVEALGFQAFAAGSDDGLVPVRRPLAAVDAEAEILALREGFARRVASERAPDLLALCASWRPDAIVWDETDFAAPVVAERHGILHASVVVAAAGGSIRPALVAGPLDELRRSYGLPPDPGLEMLGRHLVLAPAPPSFRDPAWPLPATSRAIRPTLRAASPREEAPRWLAELGGAPTVFFSLGTVFHVESGDLFSRVIAGLRDLPIALLVALGDEMDPAELGPQPPNVHVERFLLPSQVLPRCAVVVSHGGSGSVIGALAHGLPMVLLPLGADQPLNAARCEALGVARVLDSLTASPHVVRDAVTDVLDDPGYRRAAGGLRRELEALPEPAVAVSLVERLCGRES
jgi:UDP:flavonoid glycosyltransferase YjiC (YdhE family)